MQNGDSFTVVQLKELLRQRNLPTSGSKAELVMRLNTADPEGTWKLPPVEEEEVTEEEVTANDAMMSVGYYYCADSGVTLSPRQTEQLLRREIELLRREQDLRERELQFIRRENEVLRRTPIPSVSPRNKDVKYVIGLAEDFDGSKNSFWKWEKQIRLLVATYDLDEISARMLVGLKLKSGALSWFQT